MTALKYAKNIVTETKPFPKEVVERAQAMRQKTSAEMQTTRLLWLDGEVVEGASYMEWLWLWPGTRGPVEEPHYHDVAELIGFIGTNREDMHDLGGQIDIWLGDETHTLTKSCLVFIPKGLTHCPIRFNRIDKPVLWFTAMPNAMYTRIPASGTGDNVPGPWTPPSTKAGKAEYAKYIVTEMKPNVVFPKPAREIPATAPRLTRILWLDDEVAKGAFYMECVWFGEGVNSGSPEAHTHDFDEVLGFIGSNPQDPRSLEGEVELWLGGEKYILRNSCLVFIPRGVKHCPMIFRRIDMPIFHFSTGNSGMYVKRAVG